ncbi:MAG: Uma2 family endonuclease [Gammaproteobacteria bacterium]
MRGAPDLVVEVLSRGSEVSDRGYKRHLYGRYGVREFWIVDPAAEKVEVFRAIGTAFDSVALWGVKDALASTLFPGLSIDLDEVFHER